MSSADIRIVHNVVAKLLLQDVDAIMATLKENLKKADAELKKVGKSFANSMSQFYSAPAMSFNPSHVELPITRHQRYLVDVTTNAKNKVLLTLYSLPPAVNKLVGNAITKYFGDFKAMQKMDGDDYADFVAVIAKKIAGLAAVAEKLTPQIEAILKAKAK